MANLRDFTRVRIPPPPPYKQGFRRVSRRLLCLDTLCVIPPNFPPTSQEMREPADLITIADTLTHIRGDDGRMRQVVTAEMLRQVLDARGEPYDRPEGWRNEDEWDTGVRQ